MKKRIADLDRYMHTVADAWRWRPAGGPDVEAIVALAQENFGVETDQIFENNPIEYSRNLMLALISQFYNPKMELLCVATDNDTQEIIAYTWAMRDQRCPWSVEEMVCIRVAHTKMNLSARDRIFLCAQMLRMWEKWAEACEIKIICSTTIREDQRGFLHLHEQAGYVVRGSVAYKRLNKATFVVEDTTNIGTISAKTTSYDPARYNTQVDEHTANSQDRRF